MKSYTTNSAVMRLCRFLIKWPRLKSISNQQQTAAGQVTALTDQVIALFSPSIHRDEAWIQEITSLLQQIDKSLIEVNTLIEKTDQLDIGERKVN